MGHSSKKKKRGGGSARRSKGRTSLKDHDSNVDNELLAAEITAVTLLVFMKNHCNIASSAIFQEDCKVIPGSSPQIIVKLRPYSKDMGYEDTDVSATLIVRCIPGYPFKCPRLQITSESGLSKSDFDKLLSLLHDQANLNSREGREMIFNLVEAAQEFLSEIVPLDNSRNQELLLPIQESNGQPIQKNTRYSSSTGGPFVYGFIDLFSGYGESWNWGLGVDESVGDYTSINPHKLDAKIEHEATEKKSERKPETTLMKENKQFPNVSPMNELYYIEEGSGDNDKSISSTDSSSHVKDPAGTDTEDDKEDFIFANCTEADEGSFGCESSESSISLSNQRAPLSVERDLMMVHLLHLACSSKAQLGDSLPQLTTELFNLGILSEFARDLASKPSLDFNKTFDHVFQKHMVSSKLSEFWKPASDFGASSAAPPSSRYLNDFEEQWPLGHGGFGHVVLCKNKLDGRQYAMKKIRLKEKSVPVNDRILREVATLSRLQHQHVVRYYQAWFETGIDNFYSEAWGSMTAASSSFSHQRGSSMDVPGNENKLESTYLFIQMEYCPRTLRQMFESYSCFDKDLAWHFFRQIVEGLAHIHGQGIIHRDLTPSNIFFDARNDIKIGDFGLAKFLRLEQLDQDPAYPAETNGVSTDGTGQVGTYFYTAPEIEQGWPKIDEKADMYSLGVVFFELWHPFGTAMERHVILNDLKQKGQLPPSWVVEFPEQASLLRHLMSSSPSERPSATELLQNVFPPRMESELLDNFLRTMQTSEDTNIYDKVVNAIFDEEMLQMKDHNPRMGKLSANASPSIQFADMETDARDNVADVAREVFRRHCAKHLEVISMRLLDDSPQFKRGSIKLLTQGGDMLELCHELRLPFVNWIISNQKSSFKRYEISGVYRKAVGRSPPSRYLQADFDIIGGAPALTEAETIKVTKDIITSFFHSDLCDIHLNHGALLDAIWSWTGVKSEHRPKVAELLSMMGSLRPQCSERKSKWVVIRRQLLQELKLAEAIVNRLQTVGLRFCGNVDQAIPRLRGALPPDKPIRKALDELSELFNNLRAWRIERNVYIDSLMSPTESYHRDLFFQVYLMKENGAGSLSEGTLLAAGGQYDYLLRCLWGREHKTTPPGGVGTSIALETIIQNCPLDFRTMRNEATAPVLVCSRGGGGLLLERMELVAELWEENIKAEFVPTSDPSLTEQYEYANEHDIKCLVIIADKGVSQTGLVKVRHLELKKEKEVERDMLVKFLLEAMATQFRNPLIWT